MFKLLKLYHRYLTIRPFWFGLFVFATTLAVIIDFSTPFFSKLFIEKIQEGNLENVINILLVYLAVMVVGNVIGNLKNFTGDVSAVDGSKKLKLDVFKQIQDLDFAYHTKRNTGSLISAFKRGENAFWDLYDRFYGRIYPVIIGFVILFIYFSKIDIKIIAIFAVSALFTLIITRVLLPINIKRRKAVNDKEDEISGIITDNLINYETVKLFANENWESERLNKELLDWKKLVWKYFVTYRYIDTTLGNLINLSIFLVLLMAFNLVNSKTMSIPDFVLIVSAVAMFFPKLFDMVYNIRNISQGYVDIKKYLDILGEEVEVQDPADDLNLEKVNGTISFENVSFVYKSGKSQAVENINLEIPSGKSIAFVGKSGVGKTTLVRLLMRFYDPTNGVIKIDDIDIKSFSKSRLRSFMGVVPQEPILFNNTIGYNIAYGSPTSTKSEILKAAKIANIDDFIENLPNKYDTEVGERGVKLSGGQKQRLAIARMILSNPDIIIFDEATSQLDSESEKLIQDAFWRVAKGKTTIIIAHRLSTVMKADIIVVMDKGKIVEMDNHENLLKNKKSLYSKFWNLQQN